MNEKTLWTKFRTGITGSEAWQGGRIDRVENGVCDGMPDVSMTWKGVDLWVELKYVAQWPSRASTRVLGVKGLNPDQINWHLRHERAGGRSWILAGIGKEVWIAPGKFARDVNDWNKEDWATKGWKKDVWENLLHALVYNR